MGIAAAVVVPAATRGGRVDPAAALVAALAAAAEGSFDEVLAVVPSLAVAGRIPDGVTVLQDESRDSGLAGALRVALDWCARGGHDAVVVAPASARCEAVGDWQALAAAPASPVAVALRAGRRAYPYRLEAVAWPLLAVSGDDLLERLVRAHPELLVEVPLGGERPAPRP